MEEENVFLITERIRNKLASPEVREIETVRNNVKDDHVDLQQLGGQLAHIHSMLPEAQERQEQAVKDWLSRLKVIVKELGDLLDDLSLEVFWRQQRAMSIPACKPKVRRSFTRSNDRILTSWDMIYIGIRGKLDLIIAETMSFGFESVPEDKTVIIGESDLSKPEIFIGREEDMNNIKELLSKKNEEKILVIPIVGWSGLGKTTLARAVFNDEQVDSQFPLKMWVSLSPKMDERACIKKIIESASDTKQEKDDNIELEGLANHLQTIANGKSFLLVLDNYTRKHLGIWLRLKRLLEGCIHGSRIILTTQSERVARCTTRPRSRMLSFLSFSGLSAYFSMELFNSMFSIASDTYPLPRELESLMIDIVRMCDGVPLAIRTVGNMFFKSISFSSINVAEKSRLLSEWESLLPKGVISKMVYQVYSDFIGREYEKQEIKKFLLEKDNISEVPAVMSIFGIEGLGKTTLVHHVFSNPQVDKHFNLHIWVSDSNNLDVKLIIKKILELASGTSRGQEDVPRYMLEKDLERSIDGKRYLIVLDDLMIKQKEWDILRKCLRGGARGSRIITITKDNEVAHITSTLEQPHLLKPLSPLESWILFKRTALGELDEPNSLNFLKLGMVIVEKCFGVPLAVKTVGSILSSKRTVGEWASLRKYELPKQVAGDDIVSMTLQLSYDQLPVHLKLCVAFLRLFPKNYRIDVETLVRLWMVQEYASSENIGLEYFKELRNRSFFKAVETDELGNLKYCTIHDATYDVAVSVAGNESLIVEGNNTIPKQTRHVSVVDELDLNWSRKFSNATMLRTFLLAKLSKSSVASDTRSRTKNDQIMLSRFKGLLVFDLHDSRIENLSSASVKRLKQLRYLDVSGNEKLERLPDSITRLTNLQVLKLSGCEMLKSLPKDIDKLEKLKHLDCDGCWELEFMPRGLGKLASVQTLTWFVVAKASSSAAASRGDVGDLDQLNSLKELRGKLTIVNLKDVRNGAAIFQGANFKEKQHLQSLTLEWGRYDEDDWEEKEGSTKWDEERGALERLEPHQNLKALKMSGYGGVALPSWFASLNNLVHFAISRCQNVQNLPGLERMPHLKSLKIEGLKDLQCIENGGHTIEKGSQATEEQGRGPAFFPSLEELRISRCPKLEGWKCNGKETLIFHCLSKLTVTGCPQLTSFPLFPTLEGNLELKNTKTVESLILTMKQPTASHASASTSAAASSTSSSSLEVRPLSKLKILWIEGIKDLTELPAEMVDNLTSLHTLYIYDCPKLESLPERMEATTSLKELCIRNCCLLKQKYRDNKSEEWYKIKHIQNIKVGSRQVQRKGRYLLDG